MFVCGRTDRGEVEVRVGDDRPLLVKLDGGDDWPGDDEFERRMAELSVEFIGRDDLSPERRIALRGYLAELPDRLRPAPADGLLQAR